MESDLAIPSQHLLDTNILEKLTTYEDFLAFYLSLEEASGALSWVKADLFVKFAEKHGYDSVEALSKDIKQPKSTITNYIRTGKAFPIEKRIPTLSFSHHFQSSFIDSFNGEEFSSEERFKLVERAADENLSTRQIAEIVKGIREEDPAKKEAETQLNRIFAFLRGLYKEGKYEEIKNIYETLHL